METKEQLVNNIKEWIKIDNDISQFRSQIKEKKCIKKKINRGFSECNEKE